MLPITTYLCREWAVLYVIRADHDMLEVIYTPTISAEKQTRGALYVPNIT